MDQRENNIAENQIFWGLVEKNEYSDSRMDLGLMVLGIKKSNDYLKRLANLMRYKIDAGI